MSTMPLNKLINTITDEKSLLWSPDLFVNVDNVSVNDINNNNNNKDNNKLITYKNHQLKTIDYFKNKSTRDSKKTENWQLDGWYLSDGKSVSGPFSLTLALSTSLKKHHLYAKYFSYNFISRNGYKKWYDKSIINALVNKALPDDLTWKWTDENNLNIALKSYGFDKNDIVNKLKPTTKFYTHLPSTHSKIALSHNNSHKLASKNNIQNSNHQKKPKSKKVIKNSITSKFSPINPSSSLSSSHITTTARSLQPDQNQKPSPCLESWYLILKGKLRLGKINRPLLTLVFNLLTIGVTNYSIISTIQSEINWYQQKTLYKKNYVTHTISSLVGYPFLMIFSLVPLLSAPLYACYALKINSLDKNTQLIPYAQISLPLAIMLSLFPPLALYYLQHHLNMFWKSRIKLYLKTH